MADYCMNHPPHIEVRNWGIVVAGVLLGSLATVVVAARMWLRGKIQKNLDASDWFMFTGLLITIAYIINVGVAVKGAGFDHHICDLGGEQILNLLKHTFSITLIALCAGFTIKTSILLFYGRIARSHPSKSFKYINYGVLVFLTLQFISAVVALFTSCIPTNAFWNSANPYWAQSHSFHCFNKGVFILSFGAINVLVDLAITFLPTAMIWHMQIPKRQKVALWVLFSVGLISTAAAVLRMYWGYYEFLVPAGELDFTWNSWGTFFWTIIEFPVAIICGSGPTLKALFRRFFDCKNPAGSPPGPAPAMAGYHNKQRSPALPSLLPTLNTSHTSNSTSPSDSTEMSEADKEIRRLKQKNQGWGPYKTTDASPRGSMEELSSIKKDGTVIMTRHTSEGTIQEITSPGTDGTWGAASEMEMGKMLEKAGGLLR